MATAQRPQSNNNQTRNWCFTLNNYTEEQVDLIHNIDHNYLVIGREVGEQGTPHLQGFIQFARRKRFNTVRDLFPHGTHLERAQGTAVQAAEYCKKEGDYLESGDPPLPPGVEGAQATREKWERVKRLARQDQLDEIDADVYVKHYGNLKRIAKDNMQKPEHLPSVCGLWIHGTTGSGKTHAVVTQHPERYIKPLNKWWDGYQQEDVVHLDEIAPEHGKWIAPFLKLWADKWPFAAEVKGGTMQIRPNKLVVTSNYKISEMGFSDADLPTIYRRFREVEKVREQDIII